ncbi:hypothetical protein PC9H_008031 [Pleurotus ostreatus]|uniref:Trafficking protein particle complex subunit 11 n=1 Tax=Pleurotus ostreatus TaxID=5322 RepID=A0A8H6ZUL2_PLEOS|nr:uncharacterized protein PC9H_008031 [Pleurotus ostreatus]KAF7428799.1 hypothetical protein PC9H_008031 [Pleurotus ostreatus]
MNSYPPELLAQLAPVMFATGLDAPNASPQDPFSVLASRLREALLAQRKVAVWQPEKTKTFQVIVVDKEARFPPRKTVPLEDPQYSAAHSPLSPLTPTSPLHPDGLIAPIWVRKHTTMIPSVFVMFLRLYESPVHNPKSPLDPPDFDREREREQEERRRDAELSAEVALRKKTTNERGIKLTVVLMATRRMLDDPALDHRLTYIRRQSGLDSRAALFVLSPVSPAELGDFITSLQQALYEPALEYYTTHSKRVRRKRNRHSHTISSYPNPVSPIGNINLPRPLRSEGWTVRYEYKMACFAEFRGEDEVALKHYQDAYDMLVIMFGSTVILPPRTKRWAEAKVLSDCINIKITKLYLYNNEHALALSHHTTHMRKFGDFSRGWGIGEETFEYWSWMARQHRVLAELLEQGTRTTLAIPVHKPAPPPSTAALAASQLQSSVTTIRGVEYDALRSLGLNPSHALQHPGFYYYMAAKCTELRRDKFQIALEAELNQQLTATPGFTNEKKVDHYVIILEARLLYTKSYELFKKYATSTSTPKAQSQGRLTLWIAYRIAQTYYDSGKFDMAVRFFERIARTYRREKWGSMLRPLLSTWYSCAQRLEDVELSVKLLIEMMGYDVTDSEEPTSLQEDLVAILRSSVPSTEDQALVVDLPESQPIFDTQMVFWLPEVKVDESAAFQLSLSAPSNVDISELPISSLTIHFSGSINPVVIKHDGGAEEGTLSGNIARIDIGTIANQELDSSSETDETVVSGHLRWGKGSTLTIAGSILSSAPGTYHVTKLVLELQEGSWSIVVPFEPKVSRASSPKAPHWLCSTQPLKYIQIQRVECSSVVVKYRPHNVVMTLSHQAPAYLDESYPIPIEVTNSDDKALDIVMDVLLQPAEIDDAISSISVDGEQSSGLIRNVQFGTLSPGVSAVKVLHVVSTGAPGDRLVDVSIQSKPPAKHWQDESDAEGDSRLVDLSEMLQTIAIPTVAPFKYSYGISYRHSIAGPAGLADLRTFESDYWDSSSGGEAVVCLNVEFIGPWPLTIESLDLVRKNNVRARILGTFDDANTFRGEYMPGDEISDTRQVSMIIPREMEHELESIDGPGEYVIRWHRSQSSQDIVAQPTSTTIIPLPFLRPPREELVALMSAPPTGQLHTPVPVTLSIRNNHPTRSANIFVQLEPDPSDGFVVAGARSARLPILMPGSEEKITWKLIPLECGYVKIPRIKVIDRRKAIASAQGIGGPNAEIETEGETIKIINVALDRRGEQGVEEPQARASRGADPARDGIATIFILPCT